MPELPDVEVFRRYFNSTALHQKIERVEVRKEKMLSGVSPDRFRHEPVGKEFLETARHGKHLFARLDSHLWVMLHFGMTGKLQYYKNPDEEPAHARVLFHFDNGYQLAYDNMRMLGKVSLVEDYDQYIRENGLGPDALSLEYNDFANLLSQKRGMIKSAFMDQSFIAGLGNIYVDEILFHCDIHPKSQVSDLSDDLRQKLFDTMNQVLETAIDRQVNVEQFPDDYLLGHREPDAECPKCGGTIQKIKVSSRSTYFCEQHQKKIS